MGSPFGGQAGGSPPSGGVLLRFWEAARPLLVQRHCIQLAEAYAVLVRPGGPDFGRVTFIAIALVHPVGDVAWRLGFAVVAVVATFSFLAFGSRPSRDDGTGAEDLGREH